MHLLFSAISWDPQIRGAGILIVAIAILCGSVYLLLATNTGAKLGFVLAATGLSGWIFVMAVTWAIYGIGMKGREKSWEVIEAAPGRIQHSTLDEAQDFPRNWTALPTGNAVRADAQAAADTFLVPPADTEVTEGASAEAEGPPRFTSPFKETTEYVTVGAYHRWGTDDGKDNELFTIGNHKFYFRHSPHYTVIQVQPVLDQSGGAGGAPADPAADPRQPVINIVMVRDLGSLRQPPMVIALASFIIFGVCCYWLHQRDKQIWAARAAAEPVPAT